MDPTKCWDAMNYAAKYFQWDKAKKQARILRDLLNRGGDPPAGFTRREVTARINRVLDDNQD